MPHLESKTKLIMTASVNRYINTYFKQQHKQLAPQSKAPKKASFFGDPTLSGALEETNISTYGKSTFLQTPFNKIKIFYIFYPPPNLHMQNILCNFARIFSLSELSV